MNLFHSTVLQSLIFLPLFAIGQATLCDGLKAEQNTTPASTTPVAPTTPESPEVLVNTAEAKDEGEANGVAAEEKTNVTSQISITDAQVTALHDTTVASPVGARIIEVAVKPGDSVEKGDLLFRLDDTVIERELASAIAAAETAQLTAEGDVDLRYAQRTFEVHARELKLSKSANEQFEGAIPSAEIEKLQLVVDQSMLSIEQAEHQKRIYEASLDEKYAAASVHEARMEQHRVSAPVGGMVVQVDGGVGEWADPAKPLVRILSLNPIRIECFVDGRQHGPELVGKNVKFFVVNSSEAQGDNEEPSPFHAGTVQFVSPEIEPVTGQAVLWAEIDNTAGHLRPGMEGTLVLDLGNDSESD